MHYDLDLGDMPLYQGHDTPLDHGQPLCEILSRSNMAERSLTWIQILVMCALPT